MTISSNHTVNKMTTGHDSSSKLADQTDIMTHDQMLFVLKILVFGVTPGISVAGIVGNILSIIILLRHGLHKCSNILLISLAFADLSFLIGFNHVPKILYEVVGVEFAWEYSKGASTALFVFNNVYNILFNAMGCITFSMPMLITIDRLIAVFLPLKFHLIVTPMRTWSLVTLVYSYWLSIYIYMQFWFTFSYEQNTLYNVTVALIERSQFYHDNPHSVATLQAVIDYSLIKIPPIFTLVGCVAISVRIKMASVQRRKMKQVKSKDVSTRRTTKMMLAVCLVYMITVAVQSLPLYLPKLLSYTLVNDVPSNFGRVMAQVINMAVCINSSSNFIVYVVMNKNFRDTYKSLFKVCFRSEATLGET